MASQTSSPPERPSSQTQRADVAEVVLLCLAMTVAALATLAILVASTIFADYVDLWMPPILSWQMRWAVGVGWLVSLVGIGLMGRRPWLRRLGTGLIAAYLLMLAMLALGFIAVISSPTYTL